MVCSNCGKGIPMAGRVCPYCHADKGIDQQRHALGLLGAVVGGFLGSNVSGFGGAIVGCVLGSLVGFICGMVFTSKKFMSTDASAELRPGAVRKCRGCGVQVRRFAGICLQCGTRSPGLTLVVYRAMVSSSVLMLICIVVILGRACSSIYSTIHEANGQFRRDWEAGRARMDESKRKLDRDIQELERQLKKLREE